ncbi:MAG: DNA methyltransferase [bacterium]
MTIPDKTPQSYTHIPQADVAAFIAEHGTPYHPESDDYHRPPFAAPVKAGKNTTIYRAHTYHTKVPPQGIGPYIKHYTDPDDLVVDPFCGSGMTGVACLMTGRHAIVNDLSPAATHIAYNYCTPVNVEDLKSEFEWVKAAMEKEFDWLYGTTCDRCGGLATMKHTIWSDVLECSRCREPLVLWDLAVDPRTGKVQRKFTCPVCGLRQTKDGLRRLSSVPVVTSYECPTCTPKRADHVTTQSERRRIAEIEATGIPYWYPSDKLPLGRQTRKVMKGTADISRVDQFYTVRNLRALSALWHHIGEVEDERCRRALRFAFTAILPRSSRLNRLRPSGAGDPLPGTLYVSSLVREDNVSDRWTNKVDSYLRYVDIMPKTVDHSTLVNTGSATDLPVPDCVVDYIFTDPPFGNNLQYAELNFIWEVWFRELTDWDQDCVMNYVHEKDLSFYSDMMANAFHEMFRVLKPGRWNSVVFHNTDDAVWHAIQESAQEAGFEVVNALAFDKQQGTFNQVNMGKDSAAGFDVVLNLHKSRTPLANGVAVRATDLDILVVKTISEHLASQPEPGHRTIQYLHSLLIRHLLEENVIIEKVTIPYLEQLLLHHFKQVDGHWYLRGEQVAGGGLGMLVKDEASAIAWLARLLSNEPQSTGALIPQWQMAILHVGDRIPKPLEQILEENFWQDRRTGQWRIPTAGEREKMSARKEVADRARVRQIRRYVAGESDLQPTSVELCGWVQFAYEHEMFEEAVRLFANVHQPDVDEELYHKTRKIAQACQMRAGRSKDGSQLRLL